MKLKLACTLLLFTSLFTFAQIDYKGLIKNLENVTAETDLKAFFKGIPSGENYAGDLLFEDERFLMFYKVPIDKVSFSNDWNGLSMELKPFDEKEDYETIVSNLIKSYGEPEIDDDDDTSIYYEWNTETLHILLSIRKEKGEFKAFDNLDLKFK
ncbi:hypothetical protein I2486_13155 [Cellulophaga sp. E16_2]|uniref:Beta-lactamase-inhibitor-like PepSY-like domain-containing protein n=1 Tax=Cellulophaga algicola (strain DSM 14237 / IC166 / ACAM 630) TaxID=688270 RepID=E6XBB2_CELAD|nr:MULTISPECIES: hypothetical protein [Cellulophaga]ADV49976.1 hypothetical protein Celal_2691 [Cellulophaga algicola DSM 14237]MBO0592349.1 hypothetical protein [Cellulophaga sp. E16_2]